MSSQTLAPAGYWMVTRPENAGEHDLTFSEDACTAYFEENEPNTWRLANFIEAVRKQIGDAVFFASEFGTWRTKFENGVETMITLFNNAGDTAKKRQALDTKKISRAGTACKEAEALFKIGKRVADHKIVSELYADAVLEAQFADQIRQLRGVKKRTRLALRTPETPNHEDWELVFAKARKENLPQYRLSMPTAVRSRSRNSITESALLFVQSFLKKYDGIRDGNRDFGFLTEHVAKNMASYKIAFPSKNDDWLRYLLSLGRPLRNSPAHVRDGGEENVPWGSDFVIIARTAGYTSLVDGLRAVDDGWTKEEEAHAAGIRRQLWRACVLAAVTMRERVCKEMAYQDTLAAVVRPARAADSLATFGGIRWDRLTQIIGTLSSRAKSRLFDLLYDEVCVEVPDQSLSGMLLQLNRLPQSLVAPHLRLYGDTNIATLEKMARFGLKESSKHCCSEVEPAAHALLHVSCFLELLITLRIKNKYMKADFVEWEALVVALAEAADLEGIEAEYLVEDEVYKKRRRAETTDVSDDEPITEPADPFTLTSAMAHDEKTAASLVVPLLGAAAAPAKGKLGAVTNEGSSKPGKVGATIAASLVDEELLELRERVRVLEEKKLLKQTLAKLEAELEE